MKLPRARPIRSASSRLTSVLQRQRRAMLYAFSRNIVGFRDHHGPAAQACGGRHGGARPRRLSSGMDGGAGGGEIRARCCRVTRLFWSRRHGVPRIPRGEAAPSFGPGRGNGLSFARARMAPPADGLGGASDQSRLGRLGASPVSKGLTMNEPADACRPGGAGQGCLALYPRLSRNIRERCGDVAPSCADGVGFTRHNRSFSAGHQPGA